MLSVSLQEITHEDVTTLFAIREPSVVRAVVRLIAERLPELVEQEPPEWFRLVEQEGAEDDAE